MTQRERRAHNQAIAAVIDALKAYAEVNIETCGDNIIMDPLLRGGGFTAANIALSDKCSTLSTIHSAKYHACMEMIENVKALRVRPARAVG